MLDAEPFSLPPQSAQFQSLQAQFGNQFGAGGFNALFAIPNAAGPKVFNWDFSNFPGVTLDQLAAVPEPGWISAIGILGLMILRKRRRFGVAACRTSVLV